MKTEKFHRLTRQEWETVAKKLTHSELLVFYWLKSNDPYGDRYIEANTLNIATALGISRRSVQRALVKLSELRLIDLAITRFQYRVRSSVENYEDATPMSPGDTHVASTTPMSPGTTPMSSGTTPMSRFQPETSTPREFQEPKTIKTIKTNQTLSEAGERKIDFCLNKIPKVDWEKFLQFARTIASQLPDPPQLVEKWIAVNIDWIKQEFDKAYPKKALPIGKDTNPVIVQKSRNPMGWDLDSLKRLYPHTWRDAAAHFGFEVEEPPQFPEYERYPAQLVRQKEEVF
jgi:hypothetical protein